MDLEIRIMLGHRFVWYEADASFIWSNESVSLERDE